MPMVTPMGTGDSPGGSPYGSAATTAKGTSNNRTPQLRGSPKGELPKMMSSGRD
jgi:hypothetical protein